MNKKYWAILILAGVALCLAAVPRNLVVVEVATRTSCPACYAAAVACNALLSNGHPVAIIKNHTGDPFANVYSSARNAFYTYPGTPTAWFDGLNRSVGGATYDAYLTKVNERMQVASRYTVSATGGTEGGVFTAQVTVAKTEPDTNSNLKLHAVLTESHIPYVWSIFTTVENVNRLMIPDQNGSAITLNTGQETTVNLSFTPNPSWVTAKCELIFFLQNMTSKEILQGIKYSFTDLFYHPQIASPESALAFGEIYAGASATGQLVLQSTGNDTLFISGAEFFQADPAFSVVAGSLPGHILPGEQATLEISFNPPAAGAYSDPLYIHNDSENLPLLKFSLSGTVLWAPPETPRNLVLAMSAGSAQLSWDAVTQDLAGLPVVPDYYLVWVADDPSEEFLLHGLAVDPDYLQPLIGIAAPKMFYRVTALLLSRGGIVDGGRQAWLARSLRPGLSQSEVARLLRTLY